MAACLEPTPKAERTRASILLAAERLFAERGFRGTRLADVAEVVGIRRPSIVYHFKDKAALYDAVLEDALAGLLVRLEAAVAGADGLEPRVEAAAGAWVTYLAERPTLARLLLRDAVDAEPGAAPRLVALTEPFRALAERLLTGRPRARSPKRPLDPAHVASAIAGGTLFFLGAMPALVPDLAADPFAPEQLEAHRRELLRITRRLLGDSDD